MKRLLKVGNLLLPLVLFALVMLKIRSFFSEGEALTGLFVMLGALVVLVVWLGLLLRFCFLPVWGHMISERVYMASYSPDEDPLVALAGRIRREHDRELLPQFELLVRQESARPRAWTELANLLADEFRDPAAAVAALLRGAEQVPGKEDRALLLYRAARLCESRLQDSARAAEIYAEVAARYPATAYGRRALQK